MSSETPAVKATNSPLRPWKQADELYEQNKKSSTQIPPNSRATILSQLSQLPDAKTATPLPNGRIIESKSAPSVSVSPLPQKQTEAARAQILQAQRVRPLPTPPKKFQPVVQSSTLANVAASVEKSDDKQKNETHSEPKKETLTSSPLPLKISEIPSPLKNIEQRLEKSSSTDGVKKRGRNDSFTKLAQSLRSKFHSEGEETYKGPIEFKSAETRPESPKPFKIESKPLTQEGRERMEQKFKEEEERYAQAIEALAKHVLRVKESFKNEKETVNFAALVEMKNLADTVETINDKNMYVTLEMFAEGEINPQFTKAYNELKIYLQDLKNKISQFLEDMVHLESKLWEEDVEIVENNTNKIIDKRELLEALKAFNSIDRKILIGSIEGLEKTSYTDENKTHGTFLSIESYFESVRNLNYAYAFVLKGAFYTICKKTLFKLEHYHVDAATDSKRVSYVTDWSTKIPTEMASYTPLLTDMIKRHQIILTFIKSQKLSQKIAVKFNSDLKNLQMKLEFFSKNVDDRLGSVMNVDNSNRVFRNDVPSGSKDQ